MKTSSVICRRVAYKARDPLSNFKVKGHCLIFIKKWKCRVSYVGICVKTMTHRQRLSSNWEVKGKKLAFMACPGHNLIRYRFIFIKYWKCRVSYEGALFTKPITHFHGPYLDTLLKIISAFADFSKCPQFYSIFEKKMLFWVPRPSTSTSL